MEPSSTALNEFQQLLPELRTEFIIPSLTPKELQAFSNTNRENRQLVHRYLAKNYEIKCLSFAAEYGVDALAYRAARKDSVACLRFAEDYGMSDIKTYLALRAAKSNSVNVLQRLIADVDVTKDLILTSVLSGSTQAFELLWSQWSQEQQQQYAQQVLDRALEYSMIDIVKTLLSRDLRVSIKLAALSGSEELVRMLLERGYRQGIEGAFVSAWRKGYEAIVSILLEYFSPSLRKWFEVVDKRSALTKEQKRRIMLSALSEQEKELLEATRQQDVDKMARILLQMNAYENNLGKAIALSMIDNNPILDSLLRANSAETTQAIHEIFSQ